MLIACGGVAGDAGGGEQVQYVLAEYDAYLIDQMISVTTAATVMSYILYTLSEETIRKFGTANLVYTSPFVLYGLFRYLYLVHRKGHGGRPERSLFADGPLLLAVLLWVLTAILILYR